MSLINPIVQKVDHEGKEDSEAFWGRAADQLPWFRKWNQVLEWIRHSNGLSAHRPTCPTTLLTITLGVVGVGMRALIYLNERGEGRIFTYAQLLHEVERVAAALGDARLKNLQDCQGVGYNQAYENRPKHVLDVGKRPNGVLWHSH
ncbi:MAG TPA: acetyl-coenzyme A synthetase N-terminal domain-containing protein [Terriglobales bacterium]